MSLAGVGVVTSAQPLMCSAFFGHRALARILRLMSELTLIVWQGQKKS